MTVKRMAQFLDQLQVQTPVFQLPWQNIQYTAYDFLLSKSVK